MGSRIRRSAAILLTNRRAGLILGALTLAVVVGVYALVTTPSATRASVPYPGIHAFADPTNGHYFEVELDSAEPRYGDFIFIVPGVGIIWNADPSLVTPLAGGLYQIDYSGPAALDANALVRPERGIFFPSGGSTSVTVTLAATVDTSANTVASELTLGANSYWVNASPPPQDARTTLDLLIAALEAGVWGDAYSLTSASFQESWSLVEFGAMMDSQVAAEGVIIDAELTSPLWYETEARGGQYFAHADLTLTQDDGLTQSTREARAALVYEQSGWRIRTLTPPELITGEAPAPPSVAAGDFHTAAVAIDGTVWTWGRNHAGQLGDGTSTERHLPGLVLTGIGATAVSAADQHTMALLEDGTISAWGDNCCGQLGDSTYTDRSVPGAVINLTGVTLIASGDLHSLAVTSDGSLWSWGFNRDGQLGDGTNQKRHTPGQVVGLNNVVGMAGGKSHSLAVLADGSVWTWGLNRDGQLGDGTKTGRDTPGQVLGLTNIIEVAAGEKSSYAVQADGTVWAWGDNKQGQLGDGTTSDRLSPVQVPGLSDVVSISSGRASALALDSSGIVWAWGDNCCGQLGDGTLSDSSSPVQVLTIDGGSSVAGGGLHSVAVRIDGTIWAWGYNSYGQVGDGTTTNRTAPVQAGDLSSVGP